MANWCANRVAFSHSDTDMIGRVATAITTGLFSDFLPCDDPDNWHEWNCQHWGTKWDVKQPQTKPVDTAADAVILAAQQQEKAHVNHTHD